MKKYSVLIALVVSGSSHAQDWVGTWKTNELITYKTVDEYVLTPANQAANATKMERFGDFIVFNADQTFESYYTAPCGNDCFTTTAGIYTITKNNQIALTLHRLNQEGMCMQSREETADLGTYDVIKEENQMRLVKCKK